MICKTGFMHQPTLGLNAQCSKPQNPIRSTYTRNLSTRAYHAKHTQTHYPPTKLKTHQITTVYPNSPPSNAQYLCECSKCTNSQIDRNAYMLRFSKCSSA